MNTNKAKHTPGPFTVITLSGASGGDFGTEGTFKVNANTKAIDTLPKLNALLFAAPELLAALEMGEEIISGLEAEADNAGIDLTEVRAWWQKAGETIRKAKGE